MALNELAMNARKLNCNFVDLSQAVDINDARRSKVLKRGFLSFVYHIGVIIRKVWFDIEISCLGHRSSTVHQSR